MPATRTNILRSLSTVVLFGVALVWLVPLIWGVLISVRPPNQPITFGNVFFGGNDLADCTHDVCTFLGAFSRDNFGAVFDAVPWAKQYVNTLVFVFGTLIVQLVTITLACYAFA